MISHSHDWLSEDRNQENSTSLLKSLGHGTYLETNLDLGHFISMI